MDMSGGASSSAPLTPDGVDLSNSTQAFDFLQAILDDTDLQVTASLAARRFWYGVVTVIGLALVCNLLHQATERYRLRASLNGHAQPSRPVNPVMKMIATVTAVLREASYLQWTPVRAEAWLRIPTVGEMVMIAAYLGFILILEFAGNDVPGAQHYQALAVQAAWLAVAQVPLIVLLAGKNSLVGLVSGTSYQRLNVLHRWTARGLLLLATFHFGFASYGWNRYGLMQLEWSTDSCPPTGIAVYALVLWMNLTTLAPARYYAYNFFVVQHVITYLGFIIALMYHIPTTALPARNYVYAAIAFYLAERLVRTVRYAYRNIRPSRATLDALPGGATKVCISNPRVKSWAPGSHVLLAIPRFGLAQSHPAVIMSTPTSHNGELVLMLRTFGGFTKRIWNAASEGEGSRDDSGDPVAGTEKSYLALIEGPYPPAAQTDFACYDTLFLIAGGTGVTFTLSVLLALASRAQTQKLPVRVIHFNWVVRDRKSLSWIRRELLDAVSVFRAAGISIHTTAFLTCDSGELDSDWDDEDPASGCQCGEGCRCCVAAAECGAGGHDATGDNEISEISGNVTASVPVSAITIPAKGVAGLSSEKKEHTEKDANENFSQGVPWTSVAFQRPVIDSLLWKGLCEAQGESAVAVSGPLALCCAVRTTVVKISDERAVHKGTGAQGIYLHVENCS